MAMRKVNDNGAPPPHDEPAPVSISDAVRDAADDIDYAAGERAKREGLCCDYTKAPWLVKK